MMNESPIFLQRVRLVNYKSIAKCDVALGPLTFLVGQNGAGKSNFLDALCFTADSLNHSVEHALRERGGINAVRRRSTGHPTHFTIFLEWILPTGDRGYYEFLIGAKPKGGFEVQYEKCEVMSVGRREKEVNTLFGRTESYEIRSGEIVNCSVSSPPAASKDRLFLVAVSGQPEFRPLFDALTRMGFYHFNPDVIREPQSPDPGEVLASDGRNLASIVKRMTDAKAMDDLLQNLEQVVPGINGVKYRPVGKKETLEFLQKVVGSEHPWRFEPENMSDGTLRSLGVLAALFQPSSSDGKRVPLVGIEEPETALHPGAAGVLRGALLSASRRMQVLVTSHSPDLLDDKAITEVMLVSVSSEDGKSLLGPVDRASRESIREHLFTAGELLRLNQLQTASPEETEEVWAQEDLPNQH